MSKISSWRRKISTHAAALAALTVIAVMINQFFPRTLSFVQAPLANAGAKWNSWWSQYVRNPESVRRENSALKEQQLTIALENVKTEVLRRENADLKTQLGFIERQSFEHVTGRVIMRSNNPVHATFLIDRGSEDGVEIGFPVIVGGGVLVGKVIEVGRVTATVLALSDPSSKVAVSILTNSQTSGIVEGTAGSLLALRFIPQDEVVQVNDLVVTSGLEERIPPGLLIGMVNRVRDDQSAPFQEANVEPLLDEYQSTVVTILVPLIDL